MHLVRDKECFQLRCVYPREASSPHPGCGTSEMKRSWDALRKRTMLRTPVTNPRACRQSGLPSHCRGAYSVTVLSWPDSAHKALWLLWRAEENNRVQQRLNTCESILTLSVPAQQSLLPLSVGFAIFSMWPHTRFYTWGGKEKQAICPLHIGKP